MSDPDRIRLVLSVRAWPELRRAYQNWDRDTVQDLLAQRMLLDSAIRFEVVALPSNARMPEGLDIPEELFREFLVIVIVVYGGEKAARAFADGVGKLLDADAAIGADLVVGAAHDAFWSHWCPTEADDGLMGDRAAALRTVRADPALLTAAGLPGSNAVNMVFVDTGLPSRLLPRRGFKGWCVLEDPADEHGKERCPGAPLTSHGEMVARNAYTLASVVNLPRGLRLLDCPVIPDGIMNLPTFLSSVAAVLFQVFAVIAFSRLRAPAAGWVISNAWAVFDLTDESSELPYSNNPGHPVAQALKLLNAVGADIVFAAGNCGEFCPSPRCSPGAIGPSRSINGANALRQVLTVGAVRTDRLWLGYSGQGPGIAGMEHTKPDICAPSQFASDDLPGRNTGTSAACGLAAGAVALLRTKWTPIVCRPDDLVREIRDRAAQPYGPEGWQDRTGCGILDLAETAQNLP